MKRGVPEVIRRGFESVLANWPLLLIRLAENILFLIIIVVSVIALLVPVGISIGLASLSEESTPDEILEVFSGALVQHLMVLLLVLAGAAVVLLILVAIHAFVEAGAARVFVDAEMRNAGAVQPGRESLRTFTGERWLEGGRRHWWQVFLIYNIAWGTAGLIVIIPLLLVLAMILLLRETPAAAAVVGCLGVIFSLLFLFAVAVITNVWSQKAIVVTVAQGRGASDSLGEAWREFRLDAGRHIGVALILFVIMLVGSTVFASFGAVANVSDAPAFQLAIAPLQILSSLINTIFSAGISNWILACFAALTMESRIR